MSKKHIVLLLLGIAVACGLIIRFTSEPVAAPVSVTSDTDTATPAPETPVSSPIIVTPVTPSEPIDSPLEEEPAVTPPTNTPPAAEELPAPITNGQCRPGGCSGQICTDQPDIVTTCEWREEYACYQSATCERQPSGECGWTDTEELRQCLSSGGLQSI